MGKDHPSRTTPPHRRARRTCTAARDNAATIQPHASRVNRHAGLARRRMQRRGPSPLLRHRVRLVVPVERGVGTMRPAPRRSARAVRVPWASTCLVAYTPRAMPGYASSATPRPDPLQYRLAAGTDPPPARRGGHVRRPCAHEAIPRRRERLARGRFVVDRRGVRRAVARRRPGVCGAVRRPRCGDERDAPPAVPWHVRTVGDRVVTGDRATRRGGFPILDACQGRSWRPVAPAPGNHPRSSSRRGTGHGVAGERWAGPRRSALAGWPGRLRRTGRAVRATQGGGAGSASLIMARPVGRKPKCA